MTEPVTFLDGRVQLFNADCREILPTLGKVLRIFYSVTVTEKGERLFPVSRHRSRRIHKKLLKRFGGEFRRKPAMYRSGDTIYAHPAFRAQIERATHPRVQP